LANQIKIRIATGPHRQVVNNSGQMPLPGNWMHKLFSIHRVPA